MFDEGKVTEYSLNLSNGTLQYTLKGEKTEKYSRSECEYVYYDIHKRSLKRQNNPGNPIKRNTKQAPRGLAGYIIPTILLVVIMGALGDMIRRMNQTISNETSRTLGFGKAR